MVALNMNRRALISSGIGLAALGTVPAFAAGEPFFKRHNLKIGLQLYALGSDVLNNLPDALAKTKAAGYDAGEMPFEFVTQDAVKVKAAFDNAGLVCPSAQSELGPQVDVNKLADNLHIVGADTVVNQTLYPYLLGKPWTRDTDRKELLHTTPDGWRRASDFLNEKGAALKKQGVKLCFHNHNSEYAPVGDTYGMDLLMKNTEPGTVFFQLDIGWCAVAGHDPVAEFAKNKGRYWSAHVKDITPTSPVSVILHTSSAGQTKDPEMDNAIVGQGKLDWAKILAAAYDSGVRRFFVEHEDPNRTPQAVAASCAFLRRVVA